MTWALELPFWVIVLLITITLMINILIPLLISKHVLKLYRQVASKERAIYRFKNLSQYLQGAIVIISVLFIEILVLPYFKHGNVILRYLSILFPFAIVIILSFTNQLILHRAIREIRETTDSRKEQFETLIRVLMITFIPMIAYFTIMFIANESLKKYVNITNVLSIVLPVVLIISFNLVMPFFYKAAFKAIPLKDRELNEKLLLFLRERGIKRIGLFQYPTIKSKVANALVSGFIKKQVFISDYLIEKFSYEEIKSIIGHELGHIKKHHLWKRLFSFLVVIPIFAGIGQCMNMYEEYFNTKIPEIPGVIFLISLLLFYFGFIFVFFTRTQERQADAYVLETGIDPNVFISALIKLAKLNHMVFNLKKLDEKFQTHPSIAKRIRWIEQKVGIQYMIAEDTESIGRG